MTIIALHILSTLNKKLPGKLDLLLSQLDFALDEKENNFEEFHATINHN